MTPLELYYLARLWLVAGQVAYWFLMRDDAHAQVWWDACLYPGWERERGES